MSLLSIRQKPIHRGRIPTPGGVVYAASASQADVAAAVAAANNGDTVYVPAGTANWTQPLAITKFIKLIGAGSDQTVITWTGGTAANYYDSQYYIITFAPVPVVSDLKWGISGIGFDLASKWHGLYLYNASATWLNNLRITDVDLLNPRGDDRAMRPAGNIAGIIDNCTFGGGIGIQGYGHENWNLYTCAPGSVRQLYFEDCDFVGQAGSVDGPGGGGGMAYVVRYCTCAIDETGSIAAFHESHGNQPNNGGAMMNAEIYNNTYTSSVSTGSALFTLRGGSLICFGNTVGATGFTSSYIKVYEEFIDSCNGAYPINGDGLRQHPNRAYAWSNTRNSVELKMLVPAAASYDPDTATHNYAGGWVDYSDSDWEYYDAALASYGVVPQYDRDLFGYNPTFDGTANYDYYTGTSYLSSGNVAGVGVGLLAARPASCTVTGAAWWATDTETLYRWTGSEWVAYFTPYTYPHPLRSTW